MSREVDALATVIQTLKTCFPGIWISDVFPSPQDMPNRLPAVRIDLLPGSEVIPWGGKGGTTQDVIVLDIDVIGRSRAEASPLAQKVREVLHAFISMPGTGVTRVDCPAMSTRPDLNPNVRRLGVDAELHFSF